MKEAVEPSNIITGLREENTLLREQVRLLKHQLFGRKSEKLHPDVSDIQASLWELEAPDDLDEEDPPADPKSDEPRKKKPKRGRKKLPAHLERKEVILDIASEDKVCPCGCQNKIIGYERTEVLERKPAELWVNVFVRPKWACQDPECPESLEGKPGTVQVARPLPRMIPKSMGGHTLLAFVLISKFVDGLPFYRIEQQLRREGFQLPRQTMCRWAIKVAAKLEPLWRMILENSKKYEYMQMDETTLQVMNEPGRSNHTSSYMWVIRAGPPDRPIVFYNYAPSRASEIPMELLSGYSGIVQTDGYKGYSFLDSPAWPCVHAGCMNHTRRKFVNVVKAAGKHRKRGYADKVLTLIRSLYKIETTARRDNLSSEELLECRMRRSKPIMEKIKALLDNIEDKVPPKSLLGNAVRYALTRWSTLLVFLENPAVKLDTNDVENAIRPFVVGRKGWLFSGHPGGAKASAILYTMVETAKANGLNIYDWMIRVFDKLPLASCEEDYLELMPTNPLVCHEGNPSKIETADD